MTKIGILHKIKALFFVGYFTLIIFSGCKDDENNNIPLVEVNFQYNINQPEYINLQTVGGWIEVFGGSRGIILYRVSENKIMAYDRHCTFQPSNTCGLVSVDPGNTTASDTCCGSSFLMTNGSVSKPPASAPLKSYTAIFNDPILTVTN
ncbi:MAG: hypothetical protein JKY48_14370 [Flavobacteriales bacterium]|nr:hypothetical protein [Flavobacteriales bacterium]